MKHLRQYMTALLLAGFYSMAFAGTAQEVLTLNESTPQIEVPQSSAGDTYLAPVTVKAATGDEIAFDIAYTVNKATSGGDTGLRVIKTDTASPGTSVMLDLVNSSTVFSVDDVGATSTASLTATGAISGGSVSGTTIGGITEANLLDKTATETVSGAYTFSSGLTTVGIASSGAVTATTIGGITSANLLDKTATETVSGDYIFSGSFESVGIDDNATSTAITIDSGGNVGIGNTPSGTYKLEVTGDALVEGFTSNGIDDNATKKVIEVGDVNTLYGDGSTSERYHIGLRAPTGSGFLSIGGSISNTSVGAVFTLFSDAHLTAANDLKFTSNTATQLYYNYSELEWDFKANDIITTGSATVGTLTSTGIDDNATEEVMQIEDFRTYMGGTSVGVGDYAIGRDIETGALSIWGGLPDNQDGAGIVLFGDTHGTFPNDIYFLANSGYELKYVDTSSSWDFQANDITTTGNILPGGSAGPTWGTGSGTPEGAVTAPIGSLFTRTDGGASTTLYIKESGVGNTGWAAK